MSQFDDHNLFPAGDGHRRQKEDIFDLHYSGGCHALDTKLLGVSIVFGFDHTVSALDLRWLKPS
jgi:hypothetical protein